MPSFIKGGGSITPFTDSTAPGHGVKDSVRQTQADAMGLSIEETDNGMINSNSGRGDLPALRKPPMPQMNQTGMGFAVNRRFKLRHVSLPKN